MTWCWLLRSPRALQVLLSLGANVLFTYQARRAAAAAARQASAQPILRPQVSALNLGYSPIIALNQGLEAHLRDCSHVMHIRVMVHQPSGSSTFRLQVIKAEAT
jgi:uncharacterized protein YbjT (DUF2867 family)